MSAEAPKPVDPRTVMLRTPRFLPDLPMGKILLGMSELSRDPATRNAVAEMRELLEHEAGIILDAHRVKTGLDIIISSAQMLKHLKPIEAAGPAAAAFVKAEKGLFPRVIKAIEANPGLIPVVVYRGEDRGDTVRTDSVQTNITKEEMYRVNDAAIAKLEEVLLLPSRLVVIAPYGSRKTFGKKEKIRHRVINLLQKGNPVLFTFARHRGPTGRFRVYTSDHIVRFSQDDSPEEVSVKIHQEFQNLINEVGPRKLRRG